LNITNNYNLFNGQKDTYYDHATITLKPGAAAPRGQVCVLVNYFSHSSTGSYFTVDSYANYATIPVYNSVSSGGYVLRDCLDFRPRRDDTTTAYTFSNSGTILLPEPSPNLNFTVNYAYYLARIDQIILTKNGNFKIIQGASSLNPSPPKVPGKAMLLYTLTIPPFTFSSANITPQFHDNKRYTMADIGTLDKRISTLEYYTALNNLEQTATQQQIIDANGLTRPKNGILVDNFQGSSIADVTNLDYYAAIDQKNNEVRPAAKINNIPFVFNGSLSSHYTQNGQIITLPYSIVTFIDQPTASRTENLNPFNLTSWNGTMKLSPESDTWVSTTSLPAVITNLSGDNDAWAAIGQAVNDTRSPYDTVWNNWQTVSAGVATSTSITSGPVYQTQVAGVYVDQWHAQNGAAAFQDFSNVILNTTSQTVENQVRTGIQTVLSSDTITKSVGTNIVSISVIPFIRPANLTYIARSMKPLTQIYPFFDNVNVRSFVSQLDTITFTGNVSFIDTYQAGEQILDTDGSTTSGNSATIVMVKDNQAYITNKHGVFLPGKTFIGSLSSKTAIISSYQHNRGQTADSQCAKYQQGVTPLTPMITATTIILESDAQATDNYYTGNTIYLNSGPGQGLKGVITSYNGASRTATIAGGWGGTLNSSISTIQPFLYSIGNINTDTNGDVCGTFTIPNLSSIQFPTGTSVFMLSDAPAGNVASAHTKAQDSYTAQGTLETTQQQFVTTRVPVLTTQVVSQTQTVVGSPVTTSQVIGTQAVSGYFDPLAQNFLIDNNVYPDGVFVTSIRVCFASKDKNVPVTLELRPTTNGFPDSATIIPFSQVIKNPNQINITTSPSLDDPNQYTEFMFDAPICLSPGIEYSMILISNSNNYEIYTAVVGDKYLGSDRLISQPPYLGVFFKSQNASTWTPFQGENLMFRINKALFDTSLPMTIVVNSPAYSANIVTGATNGAPNNEVYIDTMYLTNQDQVLKDTTLAYGFRATANTSRVLDSTYTIIPTNVNAFFSDRKVIAPSGNSFYLQTTGASIVRDVSPIIDLERYSITAIADQINNGGLSNSNITITSPGKGYNIGNTNIITFTGGNGSGAQGAIGSVDANGNITSIIITTGGSGSGYTGNVTGTVATSGYSATANASFIVGSETNPSGGNFITKYITRMVTLAASMDAGDLNVTFDGHKPVGTQIYVYYKVLSAEDTTPFASRPYVLMSLDSTDAFATGPDDFTEYNYVGSVDAFGNPIRNITYGTFNTFKNYAIKIVMSSNNPAIVPRISQLRIFALPGTN